MEKSASENKERQKRLSLKAGALAAQIDPKTIEGQLLFLKDDQCVFGYQNHHGIECWKYLSAETLRQAFSQLPVDTGWLPKGVVRWGIRGNEEWAVLFIPAGKYPLIIRHEDKEGETVVSVPEEETTPHIPQSLTAKQLTPLPAFIFAGKANNYYLWAVKDKSFNPAGKLYVAPLPNLAQDGSICFGNTHPPRASTSTIWTAWQVFIQSAFNHHHIQGKCRTEPQDIRELLERLSGQPKFPQGELMGYQGRETKGVTVDQAINGLLLRS